MNAKDICFFESKFPLLGLLSRPLTGLSQEPEPSLVELWQEPLLGLASEPNIVAFTPLDCEVDDFVFRGHDGDA